MRETTLCYLEKHNQYLMLHRNKKPNDANQGKWIGIGGGFLDGETAEMCMVREVLEETGLHLTRCHYKGIVTFISDIHEDEIMHLFKGLAWTGDLKPCEEGELAWMDKHDLDRLPMWEGDRIFLTLLDQDLP
ncbi:MAG: 8-oxo-dGTP diphosphatase, partial [Acholeplasmataceae bacterium]